MESNAMLNPEKDCSNIQKELDNKQAGESVKEIQIVKTEKQLGRFYLAVKRLADILLSLVALVVFSPLMLIVAVLIFVDDPSFPIYKCRRVGKNGKEICIYKFRSMKKNVDKVEDVLSPEDLAQYKKEYKLDNDPRVTKVGRLIRKLSVDELPQLVNILKGELSLIGPRPVLEEETQLYGNKRDKLLSVKPGLTGYWQAYARNNAGYESGKRQEMELYYVEHASMALDIKIFFKTIETVVKRDGAK